MKRIVLFGTICLALVFAVTAAADTLPQRARGNFGMLHGQPINDMAKSEGDTIYLIGGPDQISGKFQDEFAQPEWQDWVSDDLTFSEGVFWNATDEEELVINGEWSLWCGVEYPEPGPIPVPGFGYGNNWIQNIVYTYTVDDPTEPSDVVWSMKLQYDTEAGFDIVYLERNNAGQWVQLEDAQYDGDSADDAVPPNTWIEVEHAFTVGVAEYAGPGANEVQLRIRFFSDGAWSDEDGDYSTERGACQVDDISVSVNGDEYFEDFESGTTGEWIWTPGQGVGDFAALYSNLGDLDPCRSNATPQVAFIDDGVVVPGTGGTVCITWCYGPGGYIVNNTGGLLGEDFHINNRIMSPVLEWDTTVARDAVYYEYEVYRHEELGAPNVWPGMFYVWDIRSINTGNPADIEEAVWQNRNFVYYGGPDYIRTREVVSDLLVPNRTHVQVRLGVYELGYAFGWSGVDGTPAPYFDNVSLVAYPTLGPAISTREIDIAQDNFPTVQEIQYDNLGANHVRFDAAISIGGDEANVPGDSIAFDVVAVRAGTELLGRPDMIVKMKANPIFDEFRQLPAGFTLTEDALPDGWSLIEGSVEGLPTLNNQGNPIPDRYNFDLPDEFFFYPGDVIHYHIRAEDTGGGVSTLPANLDAFGDFDHMLQFSSSFIVRALPTMFTETRGDQPKILFWNDFANRGLENEWMFALRNLGYQEGVNYDLYYTNGPSSGVGNGLGGRATEFHIREYEVLLYSVGDLSVSTLSNGDVEFDGGNDIGLLTNWLEGEEGQDVPRSAFFTGDDLVFDLANAAGSSGAEFINNFFSVQFIAKDLRGFIAGQTAPKVMAIPDNSVIGTVSEWVAYGGCPGLASFDAYDVVNAERLAEFTNASGQGGVYSYAAASYYTNPLFNNARVVLMPYDLGYVVNAPGWTPPGEFPGVAARAIILNDVLEFFGQDGGVATGVTPDAVFAVSNFPNPFNPTTTIKLNLPRTGDVSLKVFNVRGELVRTLVNGQLEVGSHDIVWDGKTNNGNQAASGVYFYETRYGSEVKVNKMALVK